MIETAVVEAAITAQAAVDEQTRAEETLEAGGGAPDEEAYYSGLVGLLPSARHVWRLWDLSSDQHHLNGR
jgi:hypothetical protein